ncbi:hypothetical protein BDV23DRAFT_193550 [Aspergillus alliaceus]|uniref:BZIP domain-containing protein n=1 Tax=Petromyces alliaceus TaxID=209559 RepID=A0A5N7CPU9_PETAA|nr:hypothetical protein BDV23DRAFT_193550 [Aspergillus alliaceus]
MSENNHHATTDTDITQETEGERTVHIRARKRGRPQKAIGASLEKDKKEKRRAQIRLAQRAYRSRKDADTESLNQRVAQLETAAQTMSEAVITLSDILLESGVLTSHPKLAEHLGETVHICLTLTKDTSDEHNQETPRESQLPSPADVSLALLDPSPFHLSYYPSSLFMFKPGDVAVMEVPQFIEQLRIACLYEGSLMLNNPSIPPEDLRRPFRLLLSLFTRETITSIFNNALQARLHRKLPTNFKQVPFVHPSAAGDGNPQTPGPGQAPDRRPIDFHPQSGGHGLLSDFSAQTQKELDGNWLDVQDLERHLLERDVRLCVIPPKDSVKSSSKLVVNVKALIVALVNKGMCLGHSPGFRRSDVEEALNSSTWRNA